MPLPPCLLIPELAHLIAQELGNAGGSEKAAAESLIALACSCRTLQQPALSVLWYELDSLVPLLRCMPADLCYVKNVRVVNRRCILKQKKLSFQRHIIPSDWTRFLFYAPFVKRFGFERKYGGIPSTKYTHIDINVYRAINVATNRKILLPNIQALEWDPSEDELFSYIHLFLGPDITDLSILLLGGADVRLSLLPVIANLYPYMRHIKFSLDTTPYPAASAKAILLTISAWNNLQELDIEEISNDALRHLVSLSDLRALKYTSITILHHDAYPGVPEYGFPALERLEVVTDGEIDNCIALIQLMSSTPLRYVHIEIHKPSPIAKWQKFFDTMHRHCRHSSLEYISLSDEMEPEHPISDTDDEELHILQVQHFESLLSFSQLKLVILDPSYGVYLPNRRVIAKIACSWPLIERLSLGISGFVLLRLSEITPIDLQPLAQYCPNLSFLGIPFDARSITTESTLEETEIFEHRLSELDVGNSPFSDASAVARVLSQIFPHINRIQTYWNEPNIEPFTQKTQWAIVFNEMSQNRRNSSYESAS